MNDKGKALLLLFCMTFMTVSCTKNETGWRGTIEEVDGVIYVKNPGEGLWDADEDAHIAITEDLRIGEMDGPDEFMFVNIADVAVNNKGDIYVADNRLNEIRKFNKGGEYLFSIGIPGQGPGEFQSVSNLTMNNRDVLIAFDARSLRFSVFSDNG